MITQTSVSFRSSSKPLMHSLIKIVCKKPKTLHWVKWLHFSYIFADQWHLSGKLSYKLFSKQEFFLNHIDEWLVCRNKFWRLYSFRTLSPTRHLLNENIKKKLWIKYFTFWKVTHWMNKSAFLEFAFMISAIVGTC